MRGKAIISFCLLMMIRITPAYAGKRTDDFVLLDSRKDHPRLCGEKHLYVFVS